MSFEGFLSCILFFNKIDQSNHSIYINKQVNKHSLTSQQAMSDQPTSSGFSWTEVVSRGLKLRVPQPASRNTTVDGKHLHYTSVTIYEDPAMSSLLRANQVESAIKSSLTPNSVIFTLPRHYFEEQFDAYELVKKQIGPVVGNNFQLHSFSRANKDLIISTKFGSEADTQKALDEGVEVDGIMFKGVPYMDKVVANHLVRVNLSLSFSEEDDVLVEKLQTSMCYYGEVVQVKKLMRRGFCEGDLTVMLDRNPGENNDRIYQDLQRMLFLEEWDCFAPASFKGAQPICYYCRKSGHLKKDCEALQALTCFGCQGKGHIRRNCPAYDDSKKATTTFEDDGDRYIQRRDEVYKKDATPAQEEMIDSQMERDLMMDPNGDGSTMDGGLLPEVLDEDLEMPIAETAKT